MMFLSLNPVGVEMMGKNDQDKMVQMRPLGGMGVKGVSSTSAVAVATRIPQCGAPSPGPP